MNKLFGTLLFSFLLICLTGKAQEEVRQLDSRTLSQPKTFSFKSASVNKEKASLTLPFFDDFSNSSHTADSKRWTKSSIYVNRTYAANPPSIGVATFDALSSQDSLYQNKSLYNNADTLQSVPLNLKYDKTAGVCLSFFYQPQGLDYIDAPEDKDSLVLNFYKPNQHKWDSIVWYAKGSKSTGFKQVVIHITDTAFLQDGFQFQFRNVISYYTDNGYPGKMGNCDFWHIDYVKLSLNNDTLVNDIAVTEPLHSMLTNYESIPWQHFKNNDAALNELSDIIKLTVRNNYKITKKIDRIYHLKEIISNGATSTFGKDALNLEADTTQTLDIERTVSLESNNPDSAIFELQAEIGTGPMDVKTNDTVRYYQIFKDYYAYDDGSAEAGYGVIGSGASAARVAVQFNVLASDTLQAVDLYFNKAIDNANQKAFYLCIWKDTEGKPGDVISESQKIDKPIYTNELNKFNQYKLATPLFLEKGIYYIGWKQRYDEFLNIGLDINKNSSSKQFYNIDGEWVNSSIKGSIMLRPYFGTQNVIKTNIKDTKASSLKLYPNPANDYCQIDNPDEQPIKNIRIFDITGRIQNINYTTNGRIETSSLKPGVYLVNITIGNNSTNLRLVVTR